MVAHTLGNLHRTFSQIQYRPKHLLLETGCESAMTTYFLDVTSLHQAADRTGKTRPVLWAYLG